MSDRVPPRKKIRSGTLCIPNEMKDELKEYYRLAGYPSMSAYVRKLIDKDEYDRKKHTLELLKKQKEQETILQEKRKIEAKLRNQSRVVR